MSKKFDKVLEQVPTDIKRFVDHSFNIVNRIHDILERQGKTQRDLANMLDKKESEISKWMRGTHNFTLKSIAKIELVLGERIIQIQREPNVTFVPVQVHSNMNKSLKQIPFDALGKWKRENRDVFSDENELKSA